MKINGISKKNYFAIVIKKDAANQVVAIVISKRAVLVFNALCCSLDRLAKLLIGETTFHVQYTPKDEQNYTIHTAFWFKAKIEEEEED